MVGGSTSSIISTDTGATAGLVAEEIARSSARAALKACWSDASEANLFKFASGAVRTYRKNASDDHLPKIWILQRSTFARARWHAPEALAVCPV